MPLRRSAVPLAAISAVALVCAFHVRAQGPADYVQGRVIVKVKDWVSAASVARIKSSLDAEFLARFNDIGAELWILEGTSVADAVDLYRFDSRIAYIEPDYILQTAGTIPDDPRFPEQWGMLNTGQFGGTPGADISAVQAWALETGEDVLVGVIDTGVDWNHSDLAENIYTNPGEIPGNGIDEDNNGFIDDVHGWDFRNGDNEPDDDVGHGTHVAGTIGAVGNNGIGVAGMSWRVKILPIKFLDRFGGTTSDAVQSIEYATMMGVRIINNSWGGPGQSMALRAAIEDAGNRGILCVAAAGNTALDNDIIPFFPSSFDLDNIVAVASTTDSDDPSFFSNFGKNSVDLSAPGFRILSTVPGNGYDRLSGTSMATAHVSGALALLYSRAPQVSLTDARDWLLSTVDRLPSLEGETVTEGRLNVFEFLLQLDNIPPVTVTLGLDIKPGSCPNALNARVGSDVPGMELKGDVLPVAVPGTAELDVRDLDVSTVRLEGLSPLRHDYDDVSAPVATGAPCDCASTGPDGRSDLVLKFAKADVVNALDGAGDGESVALTLTGRLHDGTFFEATDCIVVRFRGAGGRRRLEPSVETGEIELLTAAPNPFNPVTTIRYRLAAPMFVRLIIYDARGREIERLVEGEETSGHHSVRWNAAG
ncbi:MAG: S8 family serine peptidase, partial [Candidatus Krumholzibacteriota bacterium]|nr:S8 family serine peptidase [Candidatus Krumholzibacteriota bacterium]